MEHLVTEGKNKESKNGNEPVNYSWNVSCWRAGKTCQITSQRKFPNVTSGVKMKHDP